MAAASPHARRAGAWPVTLTCRCCLRDWKLDAAQIKKISKSKHKNTADFDLEVEAAQRARVLKQHEGDVLL